MIANSGSGTDQVRRPVQGVARSNGAKVKLIAAETSGDGCSSAHAEPHSEPQAVS